MANILTVSLVLLFLSNTKVGETKLVLPKISMKTNDSTILDVFDIGPYSTTQFNEASPPKPSLIVTPNVTGTYPVLLFYHGTSLSNSYYSQLLSLIASHGYIIVAPQLYWLIPPIPQQIDIDAAAEVINWLPSGLQNVLENRIPGVQVQCDLTKVAHSGHSRGGKTAFAVSLGYSRVSLQVNVSALIGLDPVAGTSKELRTRPHILNYEPGSFNLSIPVTIIGTGLGNVSKFFIGGPCAPNGVSHEQFFYESTPETGHFVATDYGHMDMLNDDLSGIGELVALLCKSGEGSKDLMRRGVGGIFVAFLKAYFGDQIEDYSLILKQPNNVSPIKLYPVDFLGAQSFI